MVNLTFGAIVFHSAPNKALQPTAKSAAAERSVKRNKTIPKHGELAIYL